MLHLTLPWSKTPISSCDCFFFIKVAVKLKTIITIKTSISGKGYIANMAASGHRNVQSVSDKRF